MFTQIKATAISLKPKKWDKAGNADKMEAFFRAAAQEKPDLILTTEGVLEGYVVMDVVEHPERAEAMLSIAEPIDGPYVTRFRKLAKSLKTCLCFGFAERIQRDVYNTAVFIDHRGNLCGKYHKSQFAEGTHPTWNFNRIGKQLRAFDTPLGRAGILICNDRWNPMIARTLVLDGAQLLLIPSFGSRSKSQNQAVLARARENGVPIVEANVGMNLLISQGEIVAYKWGNDQITTAVIDIPAPASTPSARAYERAYLQRQQPEMEKRYQETMRKLEAKRVKSPVENCADRRRET
jgi:predicted amidohydrolase